MSSDRDQLVKGLVAGQGKAAPHPPPPARAPDAGRETAEWARFTLEKLRPEPGDVLVLRGWAPDQMDTNAPFVQPVDPLDVIGVWIKDRGLEGVLVVALPGEMELRVLDADEMAAYGWQRMPDSPGD